jgi:glycosyltransferase EpsF
MSVGDPEESRTMQARLRREFDIAAGAKVLLFAGRLYESALFGDVKNLSFALQIQAVLRRRRIDTILLVAGDGPHRARFEARAEDLGIRDTVRFMGHRDDLPNLMRHLPDVCVFPSVHEGLGMAAIEAQVARVPVLISDGFPREACVRPAQVYRCRLADGVESWATVIEQVFAEAPSQGSAIIPGEADSLEATLFDPRRNLAALLEVYHG